MPRTFVEPGKCPPGAGGPSSEEWAELCEKLENLDVTVEGDVNVDAMPTLVEFCVGGCVSITACYRKSVAGDGAPNMTLLGYLDGDGAFVPGALPEGAVKGACDLSATAIPGCLILETDAGWSATDVPMRITAKGAVEWFNGTKWVEQAEGDGTHRSACPEPTSRCVQFVNLGTQSQVFAEFPLVLPDGTTAFAATDWCIRSICLPDGTECVLSWGAVDPFGVTHPLDSGPEGYGVDPLLIERPCGETIRIVTGDIVNEPPTRAVKCLASTEGIDGIEQAEIEASATIPGGTFICMTGAPCGLTEDCETIPVRIDKTLADGTVETVWVGAGDTWVIGDCDGCEPWPFDVTITGPTTFQAWTTTEIPCTTEETTGETP